MYALDIRIRSCDEGLIVNDVRSELDAKLKNVLRCKKRQERREMYTDIKLLRKEVRSRERNVVNDILKQADVILCTLNGASTKVLKDFIFNTILIDEATQALEPECWIGLFQIKDSDSKRREVGSGRRSFTTTPFS